jgi:hypothetical protein
MRPLTAGEVLDAWEHGQQQSSVERAISLLAAAEPAAPAHEIAAWRIGRRDDALLQLRERTFGRRLAAVVTCPACGELSDIALDVGSLRVPEDDPPATISVIADDFEVEFRLCNSLDLLELQKHPSPDAADRLFRRCIVAVRRDGAVDDTGELSAEIRDAVVAAMAAHDAQADIQLDLRCPSCDRRWSAGFDIATFLWGEIATWAERAMREVDILARVYGWSEDSILAMSPWRRERYLELAGA